MPPCSLPRWEWNWKPASNENKSYLGHGLFKATEGLQWHLLIYGFKTPWNQHIELKLYFYWAVFLKEFSFGVLNNAENKMTTHRESIEKIISLILKSLLCSHRKMASWRNLNLNLAGWLFWKWQDRSGKCSFLLKQHYWPERTLAPVTMVTST